MEFTKPFNSDNVNVENPQLKITLIPRAKDPNLSSIRHATWYNLKIWIHIEREKQNYLMILWGPNYLWNECCLWSSFYVAKDF